MNRKGMPVIRNIKGRVADNFIKPDGGFVHGEYFTHLFYNMPEIEQFQVVQESINEVVVNIKKSTTFNERTLEGLKVGITKAMGRVDIRFNFVEKILPTKSGKYRFTLSKVPVEM